MEFVSLTKDKYEMWDKFCLETDGAWFWHTTDWLEYSLAYRPDYQAVSKSFFVIDEHKPIAVCPLIVENINYCDKNIFRFGNSAFDGHIIIPALCSDLNEDRREKIYKVVFAEIYRLAQENGIKTALFRSSALPDNSPGFNILMKYGFEDVSLNTQILSLDPKIEDIWSGVRKGHKYDVHRGEKTFALHLYDRHNADHGIFEQYRQLHHKAAGRVTRPLETFEMMYGWMKKGNGLLCGIANEGRFVGFTFVILYKDGAYYMSASDDPDFKSDVPISHAVQWAIIKWLKEHGYKRYEIGVQQFGPQIFDIPSPKDLSISFFKRGFGGKTVPFFRGEKIYDVSLLGKETEARAKRLAEHFIAGEGAPFYK